MISYAFGTWAYGMMTAVGLALLLFSAGSLFSVLAGVMIGYGGVHLAMAWELRS